MNASYVLGTVVKSHRDWLRASTGIVISVVVWIGNVQRSRRVAIFLLVERIFVFHTPSIMVEPFMCCSFFFFLRCAIRETCVRRTHNRRRLQRTICMCCEREKNEGEKKSSSFFEWVQNVRSIVLTELAAALLHQSNCVCNPERSTTHYIIQCMQQRLLSGTGSGVRSCVFLSGERFSFLFLNGQIVQAWLTWE